MQVLRREMRLPMPPAGDVMTSRDARLDALYAELPTIECQGFCHTSCGPIDMSAAERERITREKGITIPAGSFLRDGPSDCVALTMLRRCSVYDIRPLVCRIWGLTKRMPCGYGCRPSRWLTEPEAYTLMARAYEISGQDKLARMSQAAALPENQAAMTAIRDRLNKAAG